MLAYGVPAQSVPSHLVRYGCTSIRLRSTLTRNRLRRAAKKCLRRAVRFELRQLVLEA